MSETSMSSSERLLDVAIFRELFNISSDVPIPGAGALTNGVHFATANPQRTRYFVFASKFAYVIHFL